MRLTVLDVKNSTIPRAIGYASCDTRLLALLNDAHQRLVMGPEMWWECYQRYEVRVTSGQITWPRQVAHIASLAVDCQPFKPQNEWFEFLGSGYGIRSSCGGCDDRIIDRGTACIFEDINTSGNQKKLKVYSSVAEDAGLTMTVLGYDASGNWIKSPVGSTWVDGEIIASPQLAAAPVTSANYFSSVTDIIKPITKSEIYLYERDDLAGTQRRIGLYEADETRPRYRRTLVAGIGTDSTTERTITCMVKREITTLYNDNDFLLIGNLPALKEMMHGVKKRDDGNLGAYEEHKREAFQLLDREAAHYLGKGAGVPVNGEFETWGAGEIMSMS